MLEPIFLPKLQIYFAEFPYNLSSIIYVLASNSGYLLRFRYGYNTSFSSYQAKEHLIPINITPSLHNNPKNIPPDIYERYGQTAMLFCSFFTLNSHHLSLLIVSQYLNIKILLFLLPIHFYIK